MFVWPDRVAAQLPEPALDPEWNWGLELSVGSLVQASYLHEFRLWRAVVVSYGLSSGVPDRSLVLGSGAANGAPYAKGTSLLQIGYRMWRPTTDGVAPWLELGGEWVDHDVAVQNTLQGFGSYATLGGDYFLSRRFALSGAATAAIVAGRTQNTLAQGAWGIAGSLGGVRLSAKSFF